MNIKNVVGVTLAAVLLAFSAVAEADYGNGYRDRKLVEERVEDPSAGGGVPAAVRSHAADARAVADESRV